MLFDRADDPDPARVVRLAAPAHRTYHYWHAFVPGRREGQVYAYRAAGPFDPARGLRFDPAKLLLDPYGRAVVVPGGYDRFAASRPGDNTKLAMRSVVVDPDAYDWEGDAPLRRPFAGTVIYETHVAGFTRHPSSGVTPRKRGTYAGLIEKIPYLRDLGITAVAPSRCSLPCATGVRVPEHARSVWQLPNKRGRCAQTASSKQTEGRRADARAWRSWASASGAMLRRVVTMKVSERPNPSLPSCQSGTKA